MAGNKNLWVRSIVSLLLMACGSALANALDERGSYAQVAARKPKTVIDYFLLCPDLTFSSDIAESASGSSQGQFLMRKYALGLLSPDDEIDSLVHVTQRVIDEKNAFIGVEGWSPDTGHFTLQFAYYERLDKSRIPGWSLILETNGSGKFRPRYLNAFYDLGPGERGPWTRIANNYILPQPPQSIEWQVEIPRFGTVTTFIPRPRPGELGPAVPVSAWEAAWDKTAGRFKPTRQIARPAAFLAVGFGIDKGGATLPLAWRDGTLSLLPLPPPYRSGEARLALQTKKGELIVGSAFDTGTGLPRPVIWENGKPRFLTLPAGAGSAQINAALWAVDKVYLAGSVQDNPFRPVLWEGEKAVILPSPKGEGTALALADLEGNILVGGTVAGPERRQVAGYWDHGAFKEIPLPSDTQESILGDLRVVAGKVTVVGWHLPSAMGSTPEAFSWTAGEKPIALRQPANAKGDRFEYPKRLGGPAAGPASILGSKRTIWRNFAPRALDGDEGPFTSSLLSDLVVTRNRTWIVGTSYDESQESGSSRAVLWDESGLLLQLDLGPMESTGALGLQVSGGE